jgi:hypothetical protein
VTGGAQLLQLLWATACPSTRQHLADFVCPGQSPRYSSHPVRWDPYTWPQLQTAAWGVGSAISSELILPPPRTMGSCRFEPAWD